MVMADLCALRVPDRQTRRDEDDMPHHKTKHSMMCLSRQHRWRVALACHFGLTWMTCRVTNRGQGVGGEGMEKLRVRSGNLEWVELSSTRFERVRCLFATAGGWVNLSVRLILFPTLLLCGME
jgi:hypothetical protein